MSFKMNWWFVVDPVLGTTVGYFGDPLFPKRKDGTAHAFNGTTTEVGTIIPVLFGTRIQTNPLLPWYGDVHVMQQKPDNAVKK